MLASAFSFPPVEELAEQEKLRNYQNRVSDWIGNQGVFFQLRYARTIGANSLIKQLGGLLAKMMIAFALVAGIGYFLLQKHFESDSYETKINGKIENALGLDRLESAGFARSRGNGGYRNLTLEGGDGSFFYNAKISDFNAPFTYLTGLTADWSPDVINMGSADFSLKAGGGAKEMEEAYSAIAKSLTDGSITSIQIDDFSCDWGYSKLTYGRIVHSKLIADRVGDQWKVILTGGIYQQNWLRDFEISEGRLTIDESGIDLVSLKLRQGDGSLDLSGTVGAPLEKPKFALSGKFDRLAIAKLLEVPGAVVREFVEGSLSGDLTISGSTNTRIEVEGTASPSEGRSLTIRERWPILKAISIMDTQRTFRRIDFGEGSFGFSTKDGGLEVSDIQLLSRDTAKLQGAFSTRLPSQEEAAKILDITLTDGFSSDSTDSSAAQQLEDDRMSLSDALRKGTRVDDLNFDRSRDDSITKDQEAQMSAQELSGVRLREQMKVHQINGDLELAIPAISFAENKNLAEIYPEDAEGWRWIKIPLVDTQFTRISEEANERILREARTRSSGLNE